MTGLDLRPLSLGEILDRTFTLYRRYFLLFAGIAGIPQLLLFPLQIARLAGNPRPAPFSPASLLLLAVSVVVYIVPQAAIILAASDLYLGRPVSVSESLRRAIRHFGSLLGVVVLSWLVMVGGLILLVVPGFYFACRLSVSVAVAVIEQRSPGSSLKRSWALTKGNAGRVFMIIVLFLVVVIAANTLFTFPFALGEAASIKDPASQWVWRVLVRVGASVGAILTSSISPIAVAIFYYDLRVRKEGFDLQFLMDREAAGSGILP